MLSTFLTRIQNYFSKYFVVGSFLPVLAFAFLNGLIAYPLIGAWRGWANTNILQATAAGAAFFTASIVVAMAVAAYVLASLAPHVPPARSRGTMARRTPQPLHSGTERAA